MWDLVSGPSCVSWSAVRRWRVVRLRGTAGVFGTIDGGMVEGVWHAGLVAAGDDLAPWATCQIVQNSVS